MPTVDEHVDERELEQLIASAYRCIEKELARAFGYPEHHSPPIGAAKDPAQWMAFTRRVQALREAGKFDQDWEDVILGRRCADANELYQLVLLFDQEGNSVHSALVRGLTGGDYELMDAEMLVDQVERARCDWLAG